MRPDRTATLRRRATRWRSGAARAVRADEACLWPRRRRRWRALERPPRRRLRGEDHRRDLARRRWRHLPLPLLLRFRCPLLLLRESRASAGCYARPWPARPPRTASAANSPPPGWPWTVRTATGSSATEHVRRRVASGSSSGLGAGPAAAQCLRICRHVSRVSRRPSPHRSSGCTPQKSMGRALEEAAGGLGAATALWAVGVATEEAAGGWRQNGGAVSPGAGCKGFV